MLGDLNIISDDVNVTVTPTNEIQVNGCANLNGTLIVNTTDLTANEIVVRSLLIRSAGEGWAKGRVLQQQ